MCWVFFAICLVCMVLAILRFGNAQANRWIYIFQAYVHPATADLDMVPSDFTGTWRSWYRNGVLKSEHKYVMGVCDGEARRWYDDGTLSAERTYRSGKLQGISREWFPDKSEKQTCEYIDGRLHGQRVYRDPYGRGYELNYDHGELHGPWFFLNGDGTRTDGGIYDHGKVVAGQAYRELS